MAPRQIAARLNREAVPSPRGGQWNASTINGNRRRRNGILSNELYAGRITYNRQRFVKDPETGRRIARPNPEREWVTREVPGLRIIEDELWERVQEIKQRYSSRWGNKRQSKKRLQTGRSKDDPLNVMSCGERAAIFSTKDAIKSFSDRSPTWGAPIASRIQWPPSSRRALNSQGEASGGGCPATPDSRTTLRWLRPRVSRGLHESENQPHAK